MANNSTQIVKDLPNKKITVVREFTAPVEQVWNAWTQSDLLELWWAPKPWKAKTKTLDFKEGGYWLYCMVGPDDSKTWARVDFKTIEKNKSFQAIDSFCDENGNKVSDFPSMSWKNDFQPTATGTKVIVEILFTSEADLQKMVEMGFEEGFTMALGNLDELLVHQGSEKVNI